MWCKNLFAINSRDHFILPVKMSPVLRVNHLGRRWIGFASSKENLLKPTSLFYRTPWRPPVVVSAKGIYFNLEDGRRLIDAVGGAAVACIGNSHPTVMQAIKDQTDKVSCEAFHQSQFKAKSDIYTLQTPIACSFRTSRQRH